MKSSTQKVINDLLLAVLGAGLVLATLAFVLTVITSCAGDPPTNRLVLHSHDMNTPYVVPPWVPRNEIQRIDREVDNAQVPKGWTIIVREPAWYERGQWRRRSFDVRSKEIHAGYTLPDYDGGWAVLPELVWVVWEAQQ